MISFFKRNLLFTSLMLLPYAILLRIKPIVFKTEIPNYSGYGYFYDLLTNLFSSQLVLSAFGIVLIFITGWMINHLNNRNRLAQSLSALPGMIYILLMSSHFLFLSMTPIVLANLFLVGGLSQLYKIYKKPKSAFFIFNAGLLFGISSLFYQPYVLLVLVGLLGVLILNSLSIKRALQFILGFLICYYLTYTVAHNFGQAEIFIASIQQVKFPFPIALSNQLYAFLGITAFLLLTVLLSYNSYMVKKSIQAQQKIDMFYWLMFLSIFGLCFSNGLEIFQITVLALPFSMMLQMNLLKFKNNFVPEFLHLLVLLGILGYQFSLHLF